MDDLDKIRTRSKEFIGTLIRRRMKMYDKKEDLINAYSTQSDIYRYSFQIATESIICAALKSAGFTAKEVYDLIHEVRKAARESLEESLKAEKAEKGRKRQEKAGKGGI